MNNSLNNILKNKLNHKKNRKCDKMKACNFSNDIIHLNSFNYSDNYLKK
jgi:hypothetical protein